MNTATENYFDLFGIAQSYEVDRQELDKAYRQLQQVSHPDRFVNQPTQFQRQAMQQTAYISEAYKVLKSPVLRASHLLHLAGISFELSTYTVTDMNLLMEQLQYREQLSKIKEAADFEKLTEFSQILAKLTADTSSQISGLFKQGAKVASEELKNSICELQFLDKLSHDLDEVEEQLMMEQ